MNETTTKKFEPQKRCFSQNLSIKFYAIPGNRAAKKTKVYLIPVLTNHAQKKTYTAVKFCKTAKISYFTHSFTPCYSVDNQIRLQSANSSPSYCAPASIQQSRHPTGQ